MWVKACNDAACVEVNSCDSGSCVEVELNDGVVRIRDSKDPDGPVLNFTREEWINFKEGVKNGTFD